MSRKNIFKSNSLMKEDIKGKMRQIQLQSFYKEARNEMKEKKLKEENENNKILNNAYKKVMSVITNFFDDINSECSIDKKERIGKFKMNNMNKDKPSQRTLNSCFVNKKPIKKNVSYHQSKKATFISNFSGFSSKGNDSLSLGSNKTNNVLNFSVYNGISNKKVCISGRDLVVNENYNIEDEEIKNINKGKRRSAFKTSKLSKRKKKIILSKGQKSFFKPKNRLKSRFGFRKSVHKLLKAK